MRNVDSECESEDCQTCRNIGHVALGGTLQSCDDCTYVEEDEHDEGDHYPVELVDDRRRVRCARCRRRVFVLPAHVEVYGDEWCNDCCGITPGQARAAAFDQRRIARLRGAA